MGSQVIPSPELRDCIQTLRLTLKRCIRVIDALIAACLDDESVRSLRNEDIKTPLPCEVAQALSLLLQAIGSSSFTLVQLSESPGLHTRDCYGISRSIVEAAVNVCYIIAGGSEVASRALRHARQKSFRDLDRESKIGNNVIHLVAQGRPDPADIPGLAEDIDAFTSRSGREKGWVDESIDDRIESVGNKFGNVVLTPLHFARFMVYRHSSEILHGTLFGALFFFGMTNSVRSQSEMEEFIGQQHMMILLATILAVSAVVEAFHLEYGFFEAVKRVRKLLASLQEIPYLNFQDINGPDGGKMENKPSDDSGGQHQHG